MKFLLIFFLLCSTVYAADLKDRVNVQIQFKKAIWTCPIDGQEDIEDRNVSGGDSYIHTCSKCSFQFNQSGSNMKEYNGSINYTPDEYSKLLQTDVDKVKSERVNAWLFEVKNPPPYVEPKPEDIDMMIEEKQAEVQTLTAQKADIVAKATLIKKVIAE